MRRSLGLVALILSFGLFAAPALAVTNDFKGGSNSNSWDTDANWSLGHVPTASEDVTIKTADPTLTSSNSTCPTPCPDGVANSITIDAGRTLTIFGKTLTVGTGTSSLNGNLAIDGSGGTAATVTLDGPTTWSGGTGTLSLFGSPATLNINSSFDITGDGEIQSAFTTLIHVSSTGSITTSNTGTAAIDAPLDNDGTVTVGSGTLAFTAGLTQTAGLTAVASGATLNGTITLNGGTLKGNGTLSGPLNNAGGTVAPGSSPGTLTITGDYTQGSGGTLAEEITGATPGTQFDQLLVGGTVTLDGTLAIDSSTFTPAVTDTFKIISGASSRTGTFATVTGADVGGLVYTPQYQSDGVLLTLATAPPVNSGRPAITGRLFVGQTLTCSPGNWTPAPTGFAFTWNRDGTPISGATASTYIATSADAGRALTCTVIASDTAGPSQPATSDPVTVLGPPVNTIPPAISGTPAAGQTLTCSNGTWTNNPTGFAFSWSRDGTTIAGVTTATFAVRTGDEGHALTCTVIASNLAGPGSPATSAAVEVPSAPVSIAPPAIGGTALPGDALRCSNGAWTQDPTAFTYQWSRDGVVITGADGSRYVVQILDEAGTITCTVTATNAAGSSRATSAGVLVAQPGTLHCPRPSGALRGTRVGPLALGMTQTHARRLLPQFHIQKTFGFDDFCLFAGWGIRVAYPSARLLRSLPAKQRARTAHRIVIALTSNPFYALHGVRAGLPVTDVIHRLHLGKPFHVGLNQWYIAPGAAANGVLKVRRGEIIEIGIADKRLTTNRTAQKRFFTSFGKG